MRLKTVLSEGWWSLAGNLSQTVAASITVLIGMFILGLFIALGTWTVSWSNHVKRELVVHVYFQRDATKAEENVVARALAVESLREGGKHALRLEAGRLRDHEEAATRPR